MDSLESQSGSPDPSQNQQGLEQGDTDITDDGESSTQSLERLLKSKKKDLVVAPVMM